MTQPTQQRVAELFERLHRIAPRDRAAALDTACGHDLGMRKEIESLLDADARAPGLLGQNAFARLADDSLLDSDSLLRLVGDDTRAIAGLTNAKLGNYRIVRTIDHGGMGVVFEAEQQQPRRRVALKIHRDSLPSDRALRRFRDEAETLSKLVHPNIARVYEAGVADFATPTAIRTPFIAMELIEGATTLTDYAREKKLSLRAALQLFATVCDAVAFSHEKGVIHRDLKPSNVLVDASGQPKLIDFGVARVIAPEGSATITRTAEGNLVGTLQYLAPELLDSAADADTRSDVYSLGVVLYEVLCHRPPHDISGKSFSAAVEMIRHQPIAPPCQVSPDIPFDVSTIVQMVLAREPAERYRSAADLAADIRRYLAGQPIEARRPTAAYRARLFVRRNRSVFAIASVAGVILILTSLFVSERSKSLYRAKMRGQLRQYAADAKRNRGETNRVALVFEDLRDSERPSHGGRVLKVDGGAGTEERRLVFVDDSLNVTRALNQSIAKEAPRDLLDESPAKDDMTLLDALLVDCFPEKPGREVVVALYGNSSDGNSPCGVLRVYDLDFKLLAETWIRGAISEMIWNAPANLIVVSMKLRALSSYVPELAAYDSADCPRGAVRPTTIVAIRPSEMGGIIFPGGKMQDGIVCPTAWAVAIDGDFAESPERLISAPNLALTRESTEDIPIRIELNNFELNKSHQLFREIQATARLDEAGNQIAEWEFESPHFRPSQPIRLIRIDMNSLAPARALAESTFRDSDNLDHALAMLENVDSSLRPAAETMLRAMYSNWRFMHHEADRLSETYVNEHGTDPTLIERARRWAATAVEIHAARCPGLDHCSAGWFALSTKADVAVRAGEYAEALDLYLQCDEINGRIVATEDYREEYYAKISVPIAECRVALGDRAGGSLSLERAVQLWDRQPKSKDRTNALEAIARLQDTFGAQR